MATKKRVRRQRATKRTRAQAEEPTSPTPRTRTRRTDEEKRALVQQVLQSGNQSAAMKELGIYPNQFYAWKKLLVDDAGATPRRGRARASSDDLLDEARRYVSGKSALLERLRAQRNELDVAIAQLEAV